MASKYKAEELQFLREAGLPMPWDKYARPRPPPDRNFHGVIKAFIEAMGSTIDDVLVDLFQSLMLAARCGDTNAAKLLVERFCGKEVQKVEVDVSESIPLADRQTAAKELASILALAVSQPEQEQFVQIPAPAAETG